MSRFPDGYPPGHALNSETLAQYLDRRQKELESQISALRGELGPKETELAQVKKVRGLLVDAHGAGLSDLASNAIVGPPSDETLGTVVALTIKDMVLRALRDHFGGGGASPAELRDYIKMAYGRDIDRNSIGPQLARLREQGAVDQTGGLAPKWKLTRAGRMYDHPSSWKDDPGTGLPVAEPDFIKAARKRGGDFLE